VLLFQPIKCRLQLSDNCLGLIVNDDQFDIDPFALHLKTSSLSIYSSSTLKQAALVYVLAR
jgi:hypothetical protein